MPRTVKQLSLHYLPTIFFLNIKVTQEVEITPFTVKKTSAKKVLTTNLCQILKFSGTTHTTNHPREIWNKEIQVAKHLLFIVQVMDIFWNTVQNDWSCS